MEIEIALGFTYKTQFRLIFPAVKTKGYNTPQSQLQRECLASHRNTKQTFPWDHMLFKAFHFLLVQAEASSKLWISDKLLSDFCCNHLRNELSSANLICLWLL